MQTSPERLPCLIWTQFFQPVELPLRHRGWQAWKPVDANWCIEGHPVCNCPCSHAIFVKSRGWPLTQCSLLQQRNNTWLSVTLIIVCLQTCDQGVIIITSLSHVDDVGVLYDNPQELIRQQTSPNQSIYSWATDLTDISGKVWWRSRNRTLERLHEATLGRSWPGYFPCPTSRPSEICLVDPSTSCSNSGSSSA